MSMLTFVIHSLTSIITNNLMKQATDISDPPTSDCCPSAANDSCAAEASASISSDDEEHERLRGDLRILYGDCRTSLDTLQCVLAVNRGMGVLGLGININADEYVSSDLGNMGEGMVCMLLSFMVVLLMYV